MRPFHPSRENRHWKGCVDSLSPQSSVLLIARVKRAMPYRSWAMANEGIFYAEAKPKPVLKLFRFRDRKTSVVTALPSPPERSERGLSVSADGRSILYMRVDTTRTEIMLANSPP